MQARTCPVGNFKRKINFHFEEEDENSNDFGEKFNSDFPF